jgi:hypothetical protein
MSAVSCAKLRVPQFKPNAAAEAAAADIPKNSRLVTDIEVILKFGMVEIAMS